MDFFVNRTTNKLHVTKLVKYFTLHVDGISLFVQLIRKGVTIFFYGVLVKMNSSNSLL